MNIIADNDTDVGVTLTRSELVILIGVIASLKHDFIQELTDSYCKTFSINPVPDTHRSVHQMFCVAHDFLTADKDVVK
jgi:hypothetical protein